MILSLALLLSTTHILSRTIHQSVSIFIRRPTFLCIIDIFNSHLTSAFEKIGKTIKQNRLVIIFIVKQMKMKCFIFDIKQKRSNSRRYLHFKRLHILTVSVLLFCNVHAQNDSTTGPGVRVTDNHANRPWPPQRSIIIYCSPTVCCTCPYNYCYYWPTTNARTRTTSLW